MKLKKVCMLAALGICCISVSSCGTETKEQEEQAAVEEPEEEPEEQITEEEPEMSAEETTEEVQEENIDMEALKQELTILQTPEKYLYDDFTKDLEILQKMYPRELRVDSLTQTPDGREVYDLVIGTGEKKVLINGGIHAREYMTCEVVMKQAVSILEHLNAQDTYGSWSYADLFENTQLHMIPMLNPDGMTISQLGMDGIRTQEVRDMVTYIAGLDGCQPEGEYLVQWKANANGVDLNRNFDALWEEYVDKAGHPSTSHYKGTQPGSEPESMAIIALTRKEKFQRTISYHAQGSVIYWYFGQEDPLYSETEEFGERISAITSYPMYANYENLDPAGYKDWALSSEGIPSLTLEIGVDTVPVPMEQFDRIWQENQFVPEETLIDLKESGS